MYILQFAQFCSAHHTGICVKFSIIIILLTLTKSNNAMSDNISNINHLAIAINTLPSIIIIAARYGSLYLIDSQQPQWSQKLVLKVAQDMQCHKNCFSVFSFQALKFKKILLNQLTLKISMQLRKDFGPIEVAAAMYYYYITDAHCCLISYNYYCYIYLYQGQPYIRGITSKKSYGLPELANQSESRIIQSRNQWFHHSM